MKKGNNIVLGITGSIGVYKAVDLASKLIQRGQKVNVIMTREAMQFVTPLTFSSIIGKPVVYDLFDSSSEYAIQHVSLAQAADVLAIVPATANIIAKLASGIADDMLTCTALATRAPIIIAPAMDANMYESLITQENIKNLKARQFVFVGPSYGHLASGMNGPGRLVENEEILDIIGQVLGRNGDLAGKKIVVTAGGTQEPLDPVRFLSNNSSGKMGYAIAEAARDRGSQVTLISGLTSLPKPVGMEFIPIKTAKEMMLAVKKAVAQSQVLIMAAAVADFTPVQVSPGKIKKESGDLVLRLGKTEDILSSVKGNFIKVGFAAESENLEEEALRKLKTKNLDLIVANDITALNSGFGVDTNQVVIITRKGEKENLPLMPKIELADRILDMISTLLLSNKPEGQSSTGKTRG